jgi:hypothetical protein
MTFQPLWTDHSTWVRPDTARNVEDRIKLLFDMISPVLGADSERVPEVVATWCNSNWYKKTVSNLSCGQLPICAPCLRSDKYENEELDVTSTYEASNSGRPDPEQRLVKTKKSLWVFKCNIFALACCFNYSGICSFYSPAFSSASLRTKPTSRDRPIFTKTTFEDGIRS